jgi:hypothetical protein
VYAVYPQDRKSNKIFCFQLVDSMLPKPVTSGPHKEVSNVRGLRLQDAQLQEMSDEGFCLSMHQPWASYLVAGIKLHEGRTWYSPHRGRLWIHAAAKEPTKEEVAQVQRQYCLHHGGKTNSTCIKLFAPNWLKVIRN